MPADLELLRRLALDEHGLAVISTVRANGTVHSSVVNAGLIDDPVSDVPSVGFVARGDALKLRLLRTAGHATIVFRRGWNWAGVQGAVRIIGPDDPDPDFDQDKLPSLLRDVFRAATGTHDDWAEYDRVMAAERRAAVFIAADRVTGNS
ncbi:pyridoxamine 5'-phosphate oxidase family protein [Amycolatopsis albispora]|uniref:Pyridoxamine 5'-phosphate oxidase n=1 Tax=Amycolatopsis albispora TaxID=1804986 RepID=A0A344L743_9PSEU|nr:pyridoxamine 5'-phosphate oxidase family protein [Amycolatopsis albispora]AXB43867.1 pyridoxamine 5'-phosphate oxidase [Amycolatopsis albispora]